MRPGGRDSLEGTIDKVVFANEDTHFTVCRFKAEGRNEPVTVVGNLGGSQAGASLRLAGSWEMDRRFGQQFRVESFQIVTPATAEGIERYLGSGLIPGVGPELARRVVETFGAETLEVIEREPERLKEVGGIGRVRAQRISEGLREHRALQDVLVFLQGHGVSSSFAVKIYRQYGPRAIQVVKENPYRLALDVWGIGFRTADGIARRLGIDRESPARAEAGLLHILGELVDEGHVHAPEHEVIARTEKLLEVPIHIVEEAVERVVAGHRVLRETLGARGACLSLRALWQAEVDAARHLARILETRPRPIPLDVRADLAAFEKTMGLELAERQRQAVEAAVRDKVTVITGGPGVGKTTIVNAILRILEPKGLRIVLGAPTGRAAKRMSETTGRPAATLHRLLEYQPRSGSFERNEERPLDADMVIVDEASMIDTVLFAHLVAAVPPAAQLILVGDVDQLPSVGPGRVLADVILSRAVTVVKLTEIYRQAARSAIVVNAHKINHGELPDLEPRDDSDFYFIERDDPAAALQTVLELVAERIPRRFGFDATDEIQVLAPMHRGEAGARNLNIELQARLNPPRPGAAELAQKARTFRVGDKVMQVKNDYDKEVFNGDVGRITQIADDESTRKIVVTFDGRPVEYEPADLDQLVHAFAVSVHKSQGSEYPAVVLPLLTQHFMLLQRNLLYTAITRGKRLVCIVGQRKALTIAVKNDDTRLRWTWLAQRLRHQAVR